MNPDPLFKEIACESNVNPIDEINKRLATNCFDSDRFEFRVNEQDFKIDLYKNGNQVELLSSGEEFLIGLALLAYDFDKRALRDLVILDEPDRHLDPKSIEIFFKIIYHEFFKNNIQVIMTTHRPDTISMARTSEEIGVFVIGQNGLVKCEHKLYCLFKLTHNLRDLINFKIKVYVEGRGLMNDSDFYEAIYAILCFYSNNYTRDNLKKREKFEIMSKRYKLFFQTASSRTEVIKSVERDFDFSKYSSVDQLKIVTHKLEAPFGLVDQDYFTPKIGEQIKCRIKILSRYSLENFLCDPYFVFSLVNPQDKDKFKELFSWKNESFKNICIDLTGVKDTTKYRNYFREIMSKLLNFGELTNNEYFKFHLNLFKVLFNNEKYTAKSLNGELNWKIKKIKKSIFKRNLNRKKGLKELIIKTKFSDLIQNEQGSRVLQKRNSLGKRKMLKDEEIIDYLLTKTEPKEYIYLNKNSSVLESFKIDYPKYFLYLRGHTIHEAIESLLSSNRREPKLKRFLFEKLKCFFSATKAESFQNICIPYDLAFSLFELNKLAREQCNRIIKQNVIY